MKRGASIRTDFQRAFASVSSALEDAHKSEHDNNDYDGDDETEDTAHDCSLQDLREDASTRHAIHNIAEGLA